jgi:hypothetical protein
MTTDKLTQAVQMIKAGNKPAALPLLKQVIQAEPNNELAWHWLYSCVDDVSQKKYCLQKVLEINPNNANARSALEKLTFVDNLVPLPTAAPAPIPAPAPVPAQPPKPAASQEITYFQTQGCLVTNRRVVFGQDTHVVRNITSVSSAKLSPNRKPGRILAVLCFLITMCVSVATGGKSPSTFASIVILLGFVGVIFGLVLSFTAKPRYGVNFVSGSGMINGLTSYDQQLVNNIVNAINQAIIERS